MMKVKVLILVTFLTGAANIVSAQWKLAKDLDADGVADTVWIENERIICRLSSQHFRQMQTMQLEYLNTMSGIRETKNGFEFYNDWMRAGYACQFRYDAKAKQIRLIGMSRYEFGNATNDGSGKSSVNLLTGGYIGEWNYHDYKTDKLTKIPVIKTTLFFEKIYLENFNDETYFEFGKRCAELYHEHKEKMIKAKKTG